MSWCIINTHTKKKMCHFFFPWHLPYRCALPNVWHLAACHGPTACFNLFSPQKYCNNKYLPSQHQARGKASAQEMLDGLILIRGGGSKFPTTAVQRSGFNTEFTAEITDRMV